MARVAGTVVEVRDGRAWIECSAGTSGCSACATGRGCAWQRRAGSHRLETAAQLDGRSLEPGDTVDLEADEGGLLASALKLYLPPLAGLLAGPALVRWAGLETGVLPLVAAAAGLMAGALVARGLTRGGPALGVRRR